jgi:hypothetical protein
MNKIISVIIGVFLTALLLNGCSGVHANAGLTGERFTNSRGETSSWQEFGSPGINFTGNRTQLPKLIVAEANGYAIKRNADTQAEIVKNMQKGEYLKAGVSKKMLVVVNEHRNLSLWFYDPLIPGRELSVNPRGGMNFVEVNSSLKEFTLYISDGRKIPVYLKPVKAPVIIGGVNADYHVKFD